MAFWQKYPYTDDHQLNLDWVIAEIQKIRAASGITYDDADTELGADNVQAAIEKLNELIAQVAQMSSAFNLIDNGIAPARWVSGYTYTHLQTVNDPTLMAIIDAVKNSKLIVLKIAGTDTNEYFYEESVKEIPGDYQHILALYNPFTNTRLQLIINGLNDSQNVFCEILPEEASTTVNSFNGRFGDVTPEQGDYAADDITLDVPDITATNVQDALVEIKGDIPATVVESFKGRIGAVTPASNDYEARQVSYDNSVSHITASDVQTAIDTIVTLVLSSGVASFNGRVGAVVPTAGDYDATQIDYDNTTSGLAATTVQEAIDELVGGGMVTVTLTLNGAKEDSITIYDGDNVQVGSCVFAANATSGTCQIDVPVGGGSFTFVSSVAKSLEDPAADYTKTISLTDSLTQTVNVFPTYPSGLPSVYPWYGNTYGYSNLVPIMTSNTSPAGEAWASSTIGDNYPYKMFDNNSATHWNPATNTVPVSVGYKFTTAKAIKAMSIHPKDYGAHPRMRGFTVYASNTGFTDNLVEIFSGEIPDVTDTTSDFALDNDVSYEYWVVTITSKYSDPDNPNPQISTLEFLGIA